MNRLVLVGLLLWLLAAASVEAGISVSEGSVSLNALETKTLCNVMIYSTYPEEVESHVSYAGEVPTFVKNIEPNDFYLKQISCPQEGGARRECIKELCRTEQDEYCKIVCTTFEGPFEVAWNPQPETYEGGVRQVVSYGAAKITNAVKFQVVYTPFNLKTIVLILIIAVGVIALVYKFIVRRPSG